MQLPFVSGIPKYLIFCHVFTGLISLCCIFFLHSVHETYTYLIFSVSTSRPTSSLATNVASFFLYSSCVFTQYITIISIDQKLVFLVQNTMMSSYEKYPSLLVSWTHCFSVWICFTGNKWRKAKSNRTVWLYWIRWCGHFCCCAGQRWRDSGSVWAHTQGIISLLPGIIVMYFDFAINPSSTVSEMSTATPKTFVQKFKRKRPL